MQKLQDSVFSIVKTTNLSPAVFSFLQPTEDFTDKTPLGGILKDSKHGWLALGPKFCVVDLRSGLKIAARTFGTPQSNFNTSVTSVVELPRPLSTNSIQLVISLQSDEAGLICVLHVNGSQLLRCIQTEVVITELALCDRIPDGPFTCFDGVVIAGSKSGELFAFDLNRASLIQALKDISQGYEHLVQNEANPANLTFLHFNALHRIQEQRELAVENNDHLAVLLNESSLVDNQYIFRNPDGTVRMKAKRDHIRVTVLQYIPQLGSLAVGYNFGAFQIWNIMTLELEFTSQVNIDCLPVTHFGFQEPCDDPRAFCYLWVVFSVVDKFEEEEFPLAVMYSLTYQGKRMLSDTKCLYQEFSTATIRFQLELSTVDESALLGGKCVSCHTYSVNSTLAAEGEESMLNICQIVWECWGENANLPTQFGMLLFDLDQWYKDQMPANWRLESNAFMSVTWCTELSAGTCVTLDVRLDPASIAVYSHATRLEEHFYPNSLQYSCVCLNTSEACILGTIGIQRQIISSIDEVGPTVLLNPARLYHACVSAGLTPLYVHTYNTNISQEEQRRYLLSVALEARLSRFLKRCAHDWATGSHSGVGCTLTFLVDWCWTRAIELKENAKELTAPLFSSSALPDRNVVRCLEHCVQQLTQLTGLLDAVLTKCCNLIIPDALSEIEEKYKGIGTVSLYLQVVQWFLRVGLLPERHDGYKALAYPAHQLYSTYSKRRLKLNRLQDNAPTNETEGNKPCPLLYIDQLIEQEFGGERLHQLWIKGGSECNGLYPPPSLYSLLRLYLLPDIAEEHKHSLVLYLLVDYSMVYDEVRYESVIRRLMQFPTMFGLSNTAIKATQAFWHLDHRDFDFALDQLQCLTGNTLSEWQHNVVLSTLLAQKKTQAALQYLHVRKPAPIQNLRKDEPCYMRVNDHDKLQDWQSCCNLYLARGLVFEALDVIRMCVQNAGSLEDKVQVLSFFFRGCRHTGNLPKVMQVTLTSLEEDVFVKYLEGCNETHTSDILVMYYLQQSRYLEAERYNNKLKQNKPRAKDVSTSVESLFDVMDRESARDAIVEVVCSSLPAIATKVAHYALDDRDVEPHVFVPKPMSVFVKAKSPKNTFTYKSSFIQDTIESASETWINKPKMRRGIKRALNIEETPFICTPKMTKTRSVFSYDQKPSESTPPKRSRLDLTGTPKTPKVGSAFKVSDKLSTQMSILLDMPDVQSPECKLYNERAGAGTPQSILKIRRNEALDRDAPSPVDSRYLGDSDDELLETASNHTHYSDSKHLRFTIPTASESGSTPSPPAATTSLRSRQSEVIERERSASSTRDKEMDVSTDSFVTTEALDIPETYPMQSPPKKQKIEESVKLRRPFKDTVRARRSLSISVNSTLSDDPNTSIESIADIPITLINPRYSGEKRHKLPETSTIDMHLETSGNESVIKDSTLTEVKEEMREVPKTPKGRRGIRAVGGESTPLINRSRSVTPERLDSPVVTPLRSNRITRSRSRTPEISPRTSPLPPIPELPKQEIESEPHPVRTTLSVSRQIRSRSRTPNRIDNTMVDSPKLEAITESPTKTSTESSSSSPSRRSLRGRSRTPDVEISEQTVKPSPRSLRRRSRTPERIAKGVVESPKLEAISESPIKSSTESSSSSPSRRSLRSRSRTPEVEITEETVKTSPHSLRSRSKTPEKLISSRVEHSARGKKSLSRIVLEHNTFTKTKTLDKMETDTESAEKTDSAIECTPMKAFKQVPSLMDVTLSPIVNKSVLPSSADSTISIDTTISKDIKSDQSTEDLVVKPTLPGFTTLYETHIAKSVLHSYQSSEGESSTVSIQNEVVITEQSASEVLKPLPAFTLNETQFGKSVLDSYTSSIAETSSIQEDNTGAQNKTDENISKPFAAFVQMIQTDFEKSVLHSAQSSIAESKDESKVKDVSSLITNDSDDEMEEKEKYTTEDSQDTAAKKEKEKIVEIEREINELEGDMSDEQNDSEESESVESEVDEEEVEEEESEEEAEEEEESSIEDSLADTDKDEIINLDSDSDEDDRLQIVEEIEPPQKPTLATNKQPEIVEIEVEHETQKESSAIANTIDPLNQANISLLTDDNTTIESDKSDVNLNYSDEKMDVEEKRDDPIEIDIPSVPTDVKSVQSNPGERSSSPREEVDGPKLAEKNSTSRTNTVNNEQEEFVDVQISNITEPTDVEKVDDPTSAKLKQVETINEIKPTASKVMEIKQIVTKPGPKSSKTSNVEKNTSIADQEPAIKPVLYPGVDTTLIQEITTKPSELKEPNDVKEATVLPVQLEKVETKAVPKTIPKLTEVEKVVNTVVEELDVCKHTEAEKFESKPVPETKGNPTEIDKNEKDKTKADPQKINDRSEMQNVVKSVDPTSKPKELSTKLVQEIISKPTPAAPPKAEAVPEIISKSSVNEKIETQSGTSSQTIETTVKEPTTTKPMEVEYTDTSKSEKDSIKTLDRENIEEKVKTDVDSKKPARRQRGKSTSSNISSIGEDENKTPITENIEEKVTEVKTDTDSKKPARRKRGKSTSSNISTIDEDEIKTPITENIEENVSEVNTDTETKKSARRKRGKSTSSNISSIDEEEIKTPVTRKRSQSNASAKSIEPEENSPQNIQSEATTTPSRQRSKTPTSTDVRKIITRRVSREMSQSLDDSKVLNESLITPKRRSTRSRSKNIDDNESVASGSTVVSVKSRVSEEGDKPVRKGRKSVLASKPELSVIPEVTAEEKTTEENTNEYLGAVRMTRHKQKLLESWLETGASDDEEAPSTHDAFDVQPIDRISLLNKTDFEGSPDQEEIQANLSSESISSDASKQRYNRATSETKAMPRAAKIHRRISVDVADSPNLSTGAESPARGRRASFNRACEALHTPKGRRTSTDLRKGEDESPVISPATSEVDTPGTPARRARRTASTQSNTSVTRLDTGKRSKKSTVDESKDTKKK